MAKFENQPVHDIGVSAGVHGKRRLLRGRFGKSPRGEGGPGVPLVRTLQKKPIRTASGRVEAFIANPKAVKRGVRYIDENLAFCLGEPASNANTYEGQLVPGILERLRNKDLVVDMHEQPDSGEEDFMYVGSSAALPILGFAAQVGITTIFVGSYGIYRHYSQAGAADVSKTSQRNDVDYWRAQFETALEEGLPSPSVEEFTIFALTSLTTNEIRQLGLNGKRLTPFEEIRGASDLLKVDRPVYTVYSVNSSSPGIEVVTQLRPHEISIEDGIVRMPTFRSLAGSQ